MDDKIKEVWNFLLGLLLISLFIWSLKGMFNYFIFQHRARKYEEKNRERADIYLYDEDFKRVCLLNTIIAKRDNEVVALLLYIFNSKPEYYIQFSNGRYIKINRKIYKKIKIGEKCNPNIFNLNENTERKNYEK